MAGFVLLLIFFAFILDMAHVALSLRGGIGFFMGVIEEGGELFSVSFLTWYLFHQNVQPDADKRRPALFRI